MAHNGGRVWTRLREKVPLGETFMPEPIEYIELRFVDILGRLKSMTVPCEPVDALEELSKDKALIDGTSLDGSSVAGLANVEQSDLRLEPDPATLIELPFRTPRTAAVMCFFKEKVESRGGSYHPRDSRGALHAVVEKLLGNKYSVRVKTEPEFHFLTREGQPFDTGGYAETYPATLSAEMLLTLAKAVRQAGMRARVIHHEVGQAQQEIEIDYDDVRGMADHLLLFKNLARTVAMKEDIGVTFMPKPFPGAAGNGLHCHIQLWQGDKNLFGDRASGSLSDTAKMFIAGAIEHSPALTALGNPSVNSYKRLVPHHEAPVYITWGFMNRTVLLRVPMFKDPQKAAVEFRSADATTNAYLLLAALIAAGFDGIERKLTPPEPRNEDIFLLTEEERASYGIETLPASLEAALDALEKDEVIKEALGQEIIEAFLTTKRKEWKEYANEVVTEWEWSKYQHC
jgi:glutamine synthetase